MDEFLTTKVVKAIGSIDQYTYVCGCDGACTREGSGGWAYKSTDGSIVSGKLDGIVTNNIAEYTALIKLLEETQSRGIKDPIVVLCDSLLVVNQLKGDYKVNHKNMIGLHARAQGLVSCLDVTVIWVPREIIGDLGVDKAAFDAARPAIIK